LFNPVILSLPQVKCTQWVKDTRAWAVLCAGSDLRFEKLKKEIWAFLLYIYQCSL
jgi:hypothetical protein